MAPPADTNELVLRLATSRPDQRGVSPERGRPLARRLAALLDEATTVVPDRRAGQGGGDCVVFGPRGVWLLRGQRLTFGVTRDVHGRLWTGCHPMTDLLDDLFERSVSLATELSTEVAPVLVVQGSAVPGGMASGPVSAVAGAQGFGTLWAGTAPSLDADQITAIGARLP